MLHFDKDKSFQKSWWTWIALVVRIAIIMSSFSSSSSSSFSSLSSSSMAMQSTMVRQQHTLKAARIRNDLGLSVSRSVRDYQRRPLYLSTMDMLVNASEADSDNGRSLLLMGLVLLLVDYLLACTLERIGQSCLQAEENDHEQRIQESLPAVIQPKRRHVFPIDTAATSMLRQSELPKLAAFLYFLSPITMTSNGIYHSTQSAHYLLWLWPFQQSMRPTSKLPLTALSLVFGAYTEPFLIVFAIPICLSLSSSSSPSPSIQQEPYAVQKFIGFVFLWTGFMVTLSYLMVGDSYVRLDHVFEFERFSHPNLGIQWYFQMQVFDRFREYFEFMLTGIKYILILPLTMRHNEQSPIVLATMFWFVFQLFHSTPTLPDLNLCFSLMVLSPRTLARTRIPSLVALWALPVPVMVFLLDSWLWLTPGTGNANYIYFMCLAYNAFVAILFLEYSSASIQRDKAIRLISKQQQQQQQQH